jgi:hypothetical protein
VEERFAKACAEQFAAGGNLADMAKVPCQYGGAETPERKERFVRAWERTKASPELMKMIQSFDLK